MSVWIGSTCSGCPGVGCSRSRSPSRTQPGVPNRAGQHAFRHGQRPPAGPRAPRTLLTTRRYRDADALAEALATFGGEGAGNDCGYEGLQGHIAVRLAHPPTRRGYWFQMLSISAWSSLPLLPLLRRPTLLLACGDDPAGPGDQRADHGPLLPDAHRHIVPGGGHLMLFDRARELAPAIDHFLA